MKNNFCPPLWQRTIFDHHKKIYTNFKEIKMKEKVLHGLKSNLILVKK